MRMLSVALLSCMCVVAGGCSGTPDTSNLSALEARIAALERRLDARRAGRPPEEAPAVGTSAPADGTDRLEADVRSLEQRLADVESEMALFRDVVAEGALGDEAAGEARRARRLERRERMRDLTAEYRQRLAEVRQEYRDDPGNRERQRSLREVVEWYRDERRAIMRGR
jgi:outer membrane murein-binding lipoprotein Lpp